MLLGHRSLHSGLQQFILVWQTPKKPTLMAWWTWWTEVHKLGLPFLGHHATNSTITCVNIKKQMFNACHTSDTPISNYYSEVIACANELRGIGVQVGQHDVQDLIIANLPASKWTTYGASILM